MHSSFITANFLHNLKCPIYKIQSSNGLAGDSLSYAIFLISMKLWRVPAEDLPAVLCRLDPTKYGLVKAALALNLRAGSYINIFWHQKTVLQECTFKSS